MRYIPIILLLTLGSCLNNSENVKSRSKDSTTQTFGFDSNTIDLDQESVQSEFIESYQEEQSPFIEANNNNSLKEIRIGESNYYLCLPDNFELSEARGKEGQLGYNIIPKDTSSTMFGFIEILGGNPIGAFQRIEKEKYSLSQFFVTKKSSGRFTKRRQDTLMHSRMNKEI